MKKVKIILGLIVILIGLFSTSILHFVNREEIEVTVVGVERIMNSETTKYLVFTQNETFENSDSFLEFKYNSSDVQGKLFEAMKNNSKMKIKVYGLRIPFFSMYRNIVEVK